MGAEVQAQALGRRLLGEVEEAGLDEVLRSVRLTASPTTPTFSLPPLDRLLPQPSPHHTPLLLTLTSPTPAPGAGKTHLLYHLATLAILSPRRPSAILILDTDHRFHAPRLTRLAAAHAPSLTPEQLADALGHVHLLRPRSLASLLASLASLNLTSDRPLAAIVLDSASAFYWPTKAAGDSSTDSSLSTALLSLARRFDCPVIATAATDLRGRPLVPAGWGRGFEVVRLVVAKRKGERGRVDVSVEGNAEGAWGFVIGGEGEGVVVVDEGADEG